jgi:hypothetical protein
MARTHSVGARPLVHGRRSLRAFRRPAEQWRGGQTPVSRCLRAGRPHPHDRYEQRFAGSQRRLLRADPSQAPGEAARYITVRCRAVGSRTGRAHGLAISRYHRGARNGSVGGRRFAGGGRAVRAARVADLALSVAHARNGILGRRRRKEGHHRAYIQRGESAGGARIRVGRRNNLDAGTGCRASECPVHGDRS